MAVCVLQVRSCCSVCLTRGLSPGVDFLPRTRACASFIRLDDKGRQVDADGKVVRMGPVLTAKANRLGNKAHNPYLQHKTVGAVRCRASLQRRATSAMIVTPPRVRCGDAGRDKIQASLTSKLQLLNSTRAPFGWLVGWLG